MGEMLSIIAHQWRQPLSVISSITTNVNVEQELGKLTTEKYFKHLKVIDSQVDYLNQTISDFRDFFKPDNHPTHFKLKTLLTKVTSLINKSLLDNNISIQIDVSDDISINTYENELIQIIINIINNSKDAIIENNIKDGYIHINVEKGADHTIIKICDNAGGIPEEILPKIMEPYFSTKGDNGTGIGLYMCHIIMDMHIKGCIDVYNHNKGVCFKLFLPRDLTEY
jgi:two-component system CheB/CheR fusion protein